jgi:hypothetical protein
MFHSDRWPSIRRSIVVAAAVAAVAVMSAPASAHPHVWVTVKSELIFAPDGPELRSTEYLRKFVESEVEKWAGVIKAANIKPE